mmetsp:Transcript_11320/g.25481  ORF Transcript_11320/g.25481 Transcript_11320/m.25481 type:complete len:245 (+) Transcript_11320:911-1645(+)
MSATSPYETRVGVDFIIDAASSCSALGVRAFTASTYSFRSFFAPYVSTCRPISSAAIDLDSRLNSTAEMAEALARATSSSVSAPGFASSSSSADAMSTRCDAGVSPEEMRMPANPVVLNMELTKLQLTIDAFFCNTRLYSLLCIPLPGPPELNDPPPPMSTLSTVTPTDPLTSRHPGHPNASMTFAPMPTAFVLTSPPTYALPSAGVGLPAGSAPSVGSSRRAISPADAPEAANAMRFPHMLVW